MGYYTNYDLKTEPPIHTIEGLSDVITSDDWGGYGIDSGGNTEDSVKWYKHERDMAELSLKFPGVLFRLRGEGEESGDIWIKYFRDGLVMECRAQITFPEFDESKLREPR